ncbi:MAG TPA: pilus assembly protein N-terminal domain-containing protein [Bryobacteraceae bacterium]|nr:pilus assembly protein N-terminal domain-containing protein [Bryobacteraceae bacterium]
MQVTKRLSLAPALLIFVAAVTVFAQGGPEDIRLTVGKSIVIDYPADIARISTSNPDIVDAAPVTAREVLVHGKAFGTVTVVVWSKSGQRNFYNVTVEQNLEPLRRLLKDTFPKEDIHVQSSRDSLSLTGRVSSKDAAERASALATPFAKQIVNNLQIAAVVEKQILLRVKFAELDRSAATQFGVNLISTGATNTIGRVSTGQFPAPSDQSVGGGVPTTFQISDALNIFAFRNDLNLGALIRALQTRNLLQILAEPNLVTTNGKEASFLVGGEFPIPVLQGGSNAGAVTIQFREFGIRLTFNPVITENNTIRLYVKPEVSALDFAHALSFNGFNIPALSSRKMETNIELGEGQSFVIAGLIDNRVTETISKIPGLSSLPILGNLFKSKEVDRNNTELVVLVTPEITVPLQPGEAKPAPVMPREFMVTPSSPTGDPYATPSKTTHSKKGR